MKKILAALLAAAILLCIAGCGSAKIEIGAQNGVLYFHHPETVPTVTLNGETEIVVEDPVFFKKLVSCIDGKPAQELLPCECRDICVVEIEKYDFVFHGDHIFIYSPMGHNIKGINITYAACTEEEIRELLGILDSVK